MRGVCAGYVTFLPYLVSGSLLEKKSVSSQYICATQLLLQNIFLFPDLVMCVFLISLTFSLPRYRCVNCINFDVCESCISTVEQKHSPLHIFLKIHVRNSSLTLSHSLTPIHACSHSHHHTHPHIHTHTHSTPHFFPIPISYPPLRPQVPLPLPPREQMMRMNKSQIKSKPLLPILYDERRFSDGPVKGRNVHPGVTCSYCRREIQGIRYLCIYCDEYNLCEKCEADPR